jgi:hypothetical protein
VDSAEKWGSAHTRGWRERAMAAVQPKGAGGVVRTSRFRLRGRDEPAQNAWLG